MKTNFESLLINIMDRIILCYHGIGEDQLYCNVSWSLFERQINWIKTLNYQITSVANIIQVNDLHPSLAITFDDGLESSLKAIIWLLEQNIPVLWSVLALPESPLHQGLTGKVLDLTTISNLLADYSNLEIASHALTHRDLTKMSLEDVNREILESRERLQNELQVPIRYFVYPFGKTNLEISNLVKIAGYDAAFSVTAISLKIKSNRYILPRLCVNEQLYSQERLRYLLGWGGGTYLDLAHLYRKFFPKNT
ncbi:putative Polysaccharide deacetylase [Planktothrix rubescens CCAP 1459/22]|uniref:Polysaccharide deacetylase n=1 Tax=Planktothrix rubescens CCAP 1459/22 TaxID=329571 RepID=A0A6J7ZEI4_PLARU|nr:putative Polysaccharide deacetylase [Planktothrix rubescens NIVA-CYA 18]